MLLWRIFVAAKNCEGEDKKSKKKKIHKKDSKDGKKYWDLWDYICKKPMRGGRRGWGSDVRSLPYVGLYQIKSTKNNFLGNLECFWRKPIIFKKVW